MSKLECEFRKECLGSLLKRPCPRDTKDACIYRKFGILVMNELVNRIDRSKHFQDIIFYTRDISDTIDKAHLMNRLYHIAQFVDRFQKELKALKMEVAE